LSIADHHGRPFEGDAVAAVTPQSGLTSAVIGSMRIVGVGPVDLFLVPTRGGDPVLHGLGRVRSMRPEVYRDGTDRLILERFLAPTWAGDGAYVLGSLGGVRGVYRVAGVSEIGFQQLTPKLVLETDAEDVTLTESGRDVPIVSIDGRLSAVGARGVEPLAIPEGAPAPVAGPILWLVREEGS
jgi:hypothetical protein